MPRTLPLCRRRVTRQKRLVPPECAARWRCRVPRSRRLRMLASYLLRLGTVGVGAWRRGSVGVLDVVRTPMRVWLDDVDTYAHMNNGRFFTLMDLGRWELSVRTGLLRAAMERKWRPVVVAATTRFRRELRPLERFELSSAIRTWDAKYFYVEHRFEKAGELHAQGFVRVVNRVGSATVPPAEMFAVVGHQGPAPTPGPELAAWIASLPAPRAP